jgi:hypothetical protein
VHANGCRRRNHIWVLKRGDQNLMSEADKAAAIFDFFNEVLATSPSHWCRLKLEALELPSLDLSTLGTRFTEEEVWNVIKEMAPDKAPGLDGFTTCFFQVAWLVIRHDLMSAFEAFWRLDMRYLHSTNDAPMVLLPKSVDAT